ncbi:hypothetical protein EKH57_13500 [Halorubrum sp. BOL3-1]|uniref:hypothetical protein n=1 Tax=Halorubrum sp. BOL3-1 TaxID=2497325 RepID=UPI001004DFDB|nr:hypothetical protein [Halorubrum sp. BOL3-1]QAU13651.1 hypothetical protein EKH57_13500 [Halorubrum sp. BOL3-1]
MNRAVPFSTGLLIGICVFAWLAGPVLESRFGVEALLAVYASVSAGTAVTAYVLVRKVEVLLTGPSDSTGRRTGRTGGNQESNRDNGEETPQTVTMSLDELEDLDVEREVRQLKSERAEGTDED